MLNNKMIFYIPDVKTTGVYVSGSTIRPQKMLQAFRIVGYDIDVVWGDLTEKREQIRHIKSQIKAGKKYDLLYAENSTMPIYLAQGKKYAFQMAWWDVRFLNYCHRKKIPVGLFYRDAYWKFPNMFTGYSSWKKDIMNKLYEQELKNYQQCVDVLFLPSMKMYKYLQMNFPGRVYDLPPGAEDVTHIHENRNNDYDIHIIYVGGIGNQYDLRLFFKVIAEFPKVKFTVCCRRNEWDNMHAVYQPHLHDNIEIIHESGDGLIPYYQSADVACLYFKPEIYREFAMAVKLFEYMSYGLTMVSSKGTAMGDFVEKNKLGWNLSYDEESLRKWLLHLLSNRSEIDVIRDRVETAREANTWEMRARRVSEILCPSVKRRG